jgi:hypothetical protein
MTQDEIIRKAGATLSGRLRIPVAALEARYDRRGWCDLVAKLSLGGISSHPLDMILGDERHVIHCDLTPEIGVADTALSLM